MFRCVIWAAKFSHQFPRPFFDFWRLRSILIPLTLGFIAFILVALSADEASDPLKVQYLEIRLTHAEQQEITKLIDLLEFVSNGKESDSFDELIAEYPYDGSDAAYQKVQNAYQKLKDYQVKSLPLLVQHLKDNRSSLSFPYGAMGGRSTVGNACYWNIYSQLVDLPEEYSWHGYSRLGRGGKIYRQPRDCANLFDHASGIDQWFKQNSDLCYIEMQIQGLKWLLTAEKKVGIPKAESYFLHILPLEIQILRKQKLMGLPVDEALKHLEQALRERDLSIVPKDLLADEPQELP
ncbi:hypothetical protein [Planctopirus hydrillae]|uniref:Uncharacterized protein n=1 Tax=Planctopirus hydrillae TaxID=1841610 RepID=A0A1C3EUB2_9PLAN|nr:hypothetical protein [Planctopirus hydrillae]ODA36806.1 hypothetical protein A6X21_01670 [Planctopirus hydrillae]